MKPRLPISLALFMLVLVVVGCSNEGTMELNQQNGSLRN